MKLPFQRNNHHEPLPSLADGSIDFVLRSAESTMAVPVDRPAGTPAKMAELVVAAFLIDSSDSA